MSNLMYLFIILQVLSAGHINYQQEQGYYEICPVYSRYPSKTDVYITKTLGVIGVYGMTKLFPKYEKEIILGACSITIGFMMYDRGNGIALKFRY